MTGVKLQHYLKKSELFYNDNVYMIEQVDGKNHNVYTNYYCRVYYDYIRISLYRTNHSDHFLIGFNIDGFQKSNYKLSELTLPTLIKELDTIFESYKESTIYEKYRNWRMFNRT